VGGKKGRSGPPGNLNGCKRPWRAFWRRRALRAEDRWILPVIDAYGPALASDKANDMTEGERRMAEIAEMARGASMLILAECARSGFIRKVDGTWDLAPGARELAKFLQVERGALQALGLERRQKAVGPTLDEYLTRYAQSPAEESNDGQ
jgi:hypothetical protein